MLPNIHIFGIQGSGKDTQANRLVTAFGLTQLSSGLLFRERMAMQDTIGTFIAKEIHAGHLLPDEFLIQIIENALRNIPKEKGVVCSGIIRTMNQYEKLDKIWSKAGLENAFGISLEVSEEVAKSRALTRKRSDDTPQALAERFRNYHEQTEPVLKVMEEKGALIRVDGAQSIDQVAEAVRTAALNRFPDLHGTH